MPNETMTPVERWRAVLERRTPDRLPLDYWGTKETTALLKRHLGCPTKRRMLEKLHVDFVVDAKPVYRGPRLPSHTDVLGCRYRAVGYGAGRYSECVNAPLARFRSIAEIERGYRWPDPDWWDYGGIPKKIRGLGHHPIRAGGSEPFLIYKKLRGQEQAFIDLIENPEIVHYALGKLFDLAYEDTRRILETIPGKALFIYVAEDLGGQSDLMFSADHIREFLLPGMKRMIALARSAGVYVFHHDDGSCRRILPDMIAAGIDILNPIQWRCPGMDREGLKRDFGGKVVFHGGMDNQWTLPFGTVEDVRRETLENIAILGRGGGYILAPCHNIQSVTPPENVVAMYETAYENG